MSNSQPRSQLNSPTSPSKTPENSSKKRNSSKKSEEVAASSEPDRAKSPEKCSICLCPPENRCYTDSCYHEFCFVCLLEWSKVKAECPLCKQKFRNIIHNIRSECDFDEYEVKPPTASSSVPDFGLDEYGRRFRYNSTMTFERMELLRHIRQMQIRLNNMRQNQHINYRTRQETERLHRLRHLYARSAERREHLTATTDFRRMIYDRGLLVREETQDDRIRDISPEFFHQNPAVTHRLIPWLHRELGVLLNSNLQQINFTIEFVLHLITICEINSDQFKRRLSSTLLQNTNQFCHEFYHFARSPFDMEEYDRRAQYQRTTVEAAELVTLSPSPPHHSADHRQVVTSDQPRRPSVSVSELQQVLALALSRAANASIDETPVQHARRLERSLGDLRRDVEMARTRLEHLRAASTALMTENLTSSPLTPSSSSTTISRPSLLGPLSISFSTTHDNGAVMQSNNARSSYQPLSYKRAFPFVTQRYNLKSKYRRVGGEQNIDDDQQGSSTVALNSSPIFDLDSSSDSSSGANSPIIVSQQVGIDDDDDDIMANPAENMFGYDGHLLRSSPPRFSQHVHLLSSSASESSPVISMSSPSPNHLQLNVSSSPIGRFSTPTSPQQDDNDDIISPGIYSDNNYGLYANEPSTPPTPWRTASWDSPLSARERPLLERVNVRLNSSNQSDDIEIVAVLKPKSLRTPELVKLDDDDESQDYYDEDKPGPSGYVPPKKSSNQRSDAAAPVIAYSPISDDSDDEVLKKYSPPRKVLFNGQMLRSVIANPPITDAQQNATAATLIGQHFANGTASSSSSAAVIKSDLSETSSSQKGSHKRSRDRDETSESRSDKKRKKHKHEHRHRHKVKKSKRDKEKRKRADSSSSN